MALVNPSTGRLFKAYERSRARYDAQHERLMEHLKKHGYEKPMHKNVSLAPEVIPSRNVIHEPPERPTLPVRGRMNAPRRAAAAAPAAPRATTTRTRRIQEIMEDEGVTRTEAIRRYNQYARAVAPAAAPAAPAAATPRRGRRPAAAAPAAAAEPEIKIKSIVYKKDTTDVGAEAAPRRARSKPVETESKASQAKPQSVMSKAWELKKANPTMSLSEAMKKAHGK